jgi:LPS O-antigen subunit length determinant protein (WzzB/FepE family)
MSFENTPEQVAPTEVATPVKKRGRPAGAKNKKPVAKKAKAIGRPTVSQSILRNKLDFANTRVVLLQEALAQVHKSYDIEVDGLRAIISYLENTLKEAWTDAASV